MLACIHFQQFSLPTLNLPVFSPSGHSRPTPLGSEMPVPCALGVSLPVTVEATVRTDGGLVVRARRTASSAFLGAPCEGCFLQRVLCIGTKCPVLGHCSKERSCALSASVSPGGATPSSRAPCVAGILEVPGAIRCSCFCWLLLWCCLLVPLRLLPRASA